MKIGKIHTMCSELSRKASSSISCGNYHIVAESTLRNVDKDLENISVNLDSSFAKCKCKKDSVMPCCERAKTWIENMFDNKRRKFNYKEYRNHYEVI